MKAVYWICGLLIVASLAASGLFWSLYISTGEDIARRRAVAAFRWTVVVVLGTFNIWIFTRVVGAMIDIWFPAKPPPPPALIDGQLPGRPAPEEPAKP